MLDAALRTSDTTLGQGSQKDLQSYNAKPIGHQKKHQSTAVPTVTLTINASSCHHHISI